MPTAADLPWQELHGNLHAFIARRVRNQADVDDLVQRVLLRIVGHLHTLRDAERVHAWIYRTARNVVVDHYRAAGSRREIVAGDAGDLAAVDAAGAPASMGEDDDAMRELAGCVRPMLAHLPPIYQQALRMVDLEGATQQEAARRAGLSLSGMKSRVQRGRQALRAVLDACCRIDLDRRGRVTDYTARRPGACACGDGGDRSTT
jgi:RNA polymerase sigma-70 factor (ECF subfamily)